MHCLFPILPLADGYGLRRLITFNFNIFSFFFILFRYITCFGRYNVFLLSLKYFLLVMLNQTYVYDSTVLPHSIDGEVESDFCRWISVLVIPT